MPADVKSISRTAAATPPLNECEKKINQIPGFPAFLLFYFGLELESNNHKKILTTKPGDQIIPPKKLSASKELKIGIFSPTYLILSRNFLLL